MENQNNTTGRCCASVTSHKRDNFQPPSEKDVSNAASGKGRKEPAILTQCARFKTNSFLPCTRAPPCSATWRGASLLPEEGFNVICLHRFTAVSRRETALALLCFCGTKTACAQRALCPDCHTPPMQVMDQYSAKPFSISSTKPATAAFSS